MLLKFHDKKIKILNINFAENITRLTLKIEFTSDYLGIFNTNSLHSNFDISNATRWSNVLFFVYVINV